MDRLQDRPCKDDSHLCMTISSCIMPILADVCKRTCGLCNDDELPKPSQQLPLPRPPQLPLPRPPQLPPVPLPLGGKQLNTLSYLKTIDGNYKKFIKFSD